MDNFVTELADGGRLVYVPAFLSPAVANELFAKLRDEIPWEQMMFRGVLQRLRTKWIGDFAYTYSGKTRPASAWTAETSLLRSEAEQHVFGRSLGQFNGVLLNYYRSGDDQLKWHADDESDILTDSPIASVSLGAARRFDLKHNHTGERLSVVLHHGSLLVMSGTTQRFWEHCVQPQRKVKEARINLTFRCYALPSGTVAPSVGNL